jgi:hypothetical protein
MEKTFEIATEPHVAVVGEHRFIFPPEIVSQQMIGPYRKLMEVYGSNPINLDPGKVTTDDLDRTEKVIQGLRNLLRELMVAESRESFDAAVVPDRTLGEMFQWIMELYGNRPTTPSNGSSASQSTNGTASTASSRSKPRRTRSAGGSVGSSMR